MSKRVWPKDLLSYLVMPITFPAWIILRTLNPKLVDRYFIDREALKETATPE
jgi:hypothetical protein